MRGERFAGGAADESGAAGDKNAFHQRIMFSDPLNEMITGKADFCVSTVSIVCTRPSRPPKGPFGP